MLRTDGVEDQTTENRSLVRKHKVAFNRVRGDALSRDASRDLILEAAEHMEDNIEPGWRTSSYTGNGGGNCVEVGDAARMIIVRDTKDRPGPVLRFGLAAWRRFADQVKAGA